MSGWIKLHRKIQDHWIWQDPVKLKWWLDILLEANHKTQKVPIKMNIVTCERGQTIRSIKGWADRWGVGKATVHRFLKMLEKDNMIVLKSGTLTTSVTVCNYEDYQSEAENSGTQMERERNARGTLAGTNKNDKNDKNEKNIGNVEIFDFEFEEIFGEATINKFQSTFTDRGYTEIRDYAKEYFLMNKNAGENTTPSRLRMGFQVWLRKQPVKTLQID